MITSDYYTLAILLMALITFVVRYAFFSQRIQIQLSPLVTNILTFTAPCVLTAMFVPIMFQHLIGTPAHGAEVNMIASASKIGLLIHSSYFWASLFAIISSLLIRQTLLVIVLSIAVFYGLRYVGFY